jgi:hypothetical protein
MAAFLKGNLGGEGNMAILAQVTFLGGSGALYTQRKTFPSTNFDSGVLGKGSTNLYAV